MPLKGIESCLVKVCFEVPPERVECTPNERSVSGKEYQIAGTAVQKKREPKKILQGIVGGWRRKMT